MSEDAEELQVRINTKCGYATTDTVRLGHVDFFRRWAKSELSLGDDVFISIILELQVLKDPTTLI